jgi:CcmD family protein
MHRILLFILFISSFYQVAAQTTAPTDFMRSNGKIYVVMAVVVVIVVGLLLYVISLDRKITKIEKMKNKDNHHL